MTRPNMRVLRAGGTRLAQIETECRTKWGVCLTISEFGAELWKCAARNNSSGIFLPQHHNLIMFQYSK